MRFSSKKNKVLIMVVAVVLLVSLLNFFQKEVRSFFYSVSAPIQKVLFRAGESTSDFLQSILRVKTLKQELDELKLENQELLSQERLAKFMRNSQK